MAVKNRIDDLDQVCGKEVIIKAHHLAGFFRPVDQEGLAGPACPRPVAVVAANGPDWMGPHDLQLFFLDFCLTPGWRIAVMVAAESEHTLDIREGLSSAESNFFCRAGLAERALVMVEQPPADAGLFRNLFLPGIG